MRMEMKMNKMRMLLCVTKKTRLHCFWEKSITGVQRKTSAYGKQMGK